LKTRNVDAWLDQYEIRGGESILEAIENAISHIDTFLVVLSSNSLKSQWVRHELQMISHQVITAERTMIPLLIERCELPLFLRTRKFIDFTKDYELALRELISSIEHWQLAKKDEVLISMINDLENKRGSLTRSIDQN